MGNIRLEALPRERGNKGSKNRLRNKGLLPAVVYGRGQEPRTITLESAALKRALGTAAGSNVLLDLEIKGDDGVSLETVMVKELQKYPLQWDFYLHADLIRISLEDKLEVGVPLSLVGEPAGVQDGGVLQIQLREVLVSCLPMDIPEYIEVAVDSLEIGGVLTVADLQLPAGVEMLADPAETIASVIVPHVGEVEAEEELEEGEAAAGAEEGEGETGAAEGE